MIATRVVDPKDADVFLVPVFASLLVNTYRRHQYPAFARLGVSKGQVALGTTLGSFRGATISILVLICKGGRVPDLIAFHSPSCVRGCPACAGGAGHAPELLPLVEAQRG